MGILGKLLLVLNLFLGAGVVYLVTADWAARQAVEASAVKHQLVIQGLPVVKPVDIDAGSESVALGTVTSGLTRVDAVNKKFLADYFSGTTGEELAGTAVPSSQLDEVQAVRSKAAAKLGGTPQEQLTLLCGNFTANGAFTPGWLTGMAESSVERGFLRAMVSAQALADPRRVEANAKTARALFDKRFEAVETINPQLAAEEADRVKNAGVAIKKAADASRQAFDNYEQLTRPGQAGEPDAVRQAADAADAAIAKLAETQAALNEVFAGQGRAASRDEPDRRRRIAHLLMHLNETAGWQKRVALVVGLETYLRVVADQAARLRRMTTSAEQETILDQARFTADYDLLKQLALSQATLLDSQVEVRANTEAQRANAEAAARQRLAFLQQRRAELAAIRREVEATLTAQAETEQRLFATQQLVGETLRKNFELEDQLAAAEAKAQ